MLFDFYARRRFLQEVRLKNEITRAEMNEEAERAMQLQRQVGVAHRIWGFGVQAPSRALGRVLR